jgi:hypothetical protein
MPGSKLRRLFDKFDLSTTGKRLSHEVGTISNHDNDSFNPNFAQGVQHVIDHRPAAHWEQYFRQIGLHSRPFAGSHDNRDRFWHSLVSAALVNNRIMTSSPVV